MFVPNAMLNRVLRSALVDLSPNQVAKVRALSASSAVGAAAYDRYAEAAAGLPPRQSASTASAPLSEDTQASFVRFRAADARTIVRAMIAAASADSPIGPRRRRRIERFLRNAGGAAEELAFAQSEMQRPATPDELAEGVEDPELAFEIYAAALLATKAATAGAREFLARLAQALNLQPEFVVKLHRSWGDPVPESVASAARDARPPPE